MGVKFGMEEGTFGPLLLAKFHPHRCNVSPLRGEKPQNRPLSKRNTGRFALRAMLPVITDESGIVRIYSPLSLYTLLHYINRHLLYLLAICQLIRRKAVPGIGYSAVEEIATSLPLYGS